MHTQADVILRLKSLFENERYRNVLRQLLSDQGAFQEWEKTFDDSEKNELNQLRDGLLTLFTDDNASQIEFSEYLKKIKELRLNGTDSIDITLEQLQKLEFIAKQRTFPERLPSYFYKATNITIDGKREDRQIELTIFEKILSKFSSLREKVTSLVFQAPHRKAVHKIPLSTSRNRQLQNDFDEYAQPVKLFNENGFIRGNFWGDFSKIKRDFSQVDNLAAYAQVYEWLSEKYQDYYLTQGLAIKNQIYNINYAQKEIVSLAGMTMHDADLTPTQYNQAEHYFYFMGNSQTMEDYYYQMKKDIKVAKKNGFNIVAHILNPRGVAKSQNEVKTADDIINDYRTIIQHTIDELNNDNPRNDIPRGSNVTIVGHSLGAGVGAEVAMQLHQKKDDNGKKLYNVKFEDSLSFANTAEAVSLEQIIIERVKPLIKLEKNPKKSSRFIGILTKVLRAFGWQIEALKAYEKIPTEYTWYKGLKGKKAEESTTKHKKENNKHLNHDGVIDYQGAFFRQVKLSKDMLHEKIVYCELMLRLARSVGKVGAEGDDKQYFREEVKLSKAKALLNKKDVKPELIHEEIKGIFGKLEKAFVKNETIKKKVSLKALKSGYLEEVTLEIVKKDDSTIVKGSRKEVKRSRKEDMHIKQLYELLESNKDKLNTWSLLASGNNFDASGTLTLQEFSNNLKKLHNERFKAPLFYVEEVQGNTKAHNKLRHAQKSHHQDENAHDYTIAMTMRRNKIIKIMQETEESNTENNQDTQGFYPSLKK